MSRVSEFQYTVTLRGPKAVFKENDMVEIIQGILAKHLPEDVEEVEVE